MFGDSVAKIAGDVRSDAFDRLGACAAVLDCDGVIVDTNQTWRLFTHLNDGSSAATGVGINYLDVCDRASAAGVMAGAAVAAGLRQILSGESERMDIEYPCPSPTEDRWFLMQASSVPVRDGAGVVVFHVDITARKLLTDRLGVLADHDALTGLPNRRAAVRYLEQQLDFARDTDQAVCVLFIDLNEFKAVNDTYGHHVGDELLVKVGMRARRALRHDDHLCRFGGDEYVVICAGLDHQQAVDLADRLRSVMVAPFQIGDLEVQGHISVGIAERDAVATAESMLRNADQQMYVEKRGERPLPAPIDIRAGLSRDPSKRSPSATAVRTDGASFEWQSGERTRAAAALTNSNELVLFFGTDGTIAWASPACTRLLGVRAEELVGLNGMNLIHPEDRAVAVSAFMSIPNLGDRVTTDFRVIDTEGRTRWVEEIATNLVDDPDVGFVVGNLRDVTERVHLLQRIELDRRRLADAQVAARLGSFEIDLRTGDIARSDELCRIVGVPVGSAGNSDVLDTVHPDDRERLSGMLAQAIAGQEQGELEYRIVRPDGEVRWVVTHGGKLTEPNDHIVAGTMLDVTDRHAAHEALTIQATHDWLTGVLNRASLERGLDALLVAVEPGSRVVAAVVGIDNFRHANDVSGTATGDEMLRILATRLTAWAEPGDLIGRVRGDQLMVARRGPTSGFSALDFGQTLRAVLSDPLAPTNTQAVFPRLAFSVGVATSTAGDSAESMLADADAAMHDAKGAGGDRAIVFDDDARARATRRRMINGALPFALERNELRLEYQPILELAGLRTVGFEALLRWTHPDLGQISPNEFIPLAESSHLIGPIGTWVLEQALQQLAEWRLEPGTPPRLWMAINVSAQQLAGGQFAALVSDTVTRTGVPAEAVHIELTESVLVDRIDDAICMISEIRSLGVNINIDDFGTGYSSLSYLSRLPVDAIKIDQSFVAALAGPRDGTAIIRAMVTLAEHLDLDVIAEGVESEQQRDTLRALGCTHAQGFLWSPSLTPDAAQRWILDARPSQ